MIFGLRANRLLIIQPFSVSIAELVALMKHLQLQLLPSRSQSPRYDDVALCDRVLDQRRYTNSQRGKYDVPKEVHQA